jgi:hypothetical protein
MQRHGAILVSGPPFVPNFQFLDNSPCRRPFKIPILARVTSQLCEH